MKRYQVFTFNQYYPSGGWADRVGSTDSLREAWQMYNDGNDDGQIIDMETETDVTSVAWSEWGSN